MPHPIPDPLRGRPFTTAEAAAHGITRSMLRGPRFDLVHRGHGVWVEHAEQHRPTVLLAADRLILPADAAVSHVTGLRLHGVDIGTDHPRHWSTTTTAQVRSPDVVLHRRGRALRPGQVDGIAVLSPHRCLVDAAISLSHRDIVAVGDALIRLGLMDRDEFEHFAWTRRLHGVRRSRHNVGSMRERVDSFRETDVRLILTVAGLPEPEVNTLIIDDGGDKIARGDLVLRRWRVVVEYDGWHHERSARQRRIDIMRREALEAAGWLVIVLTNDDVRHPAALISRVWRALVLREYRGPAPRFDSDALAEIWRNPKA